MGIQELTLEVDNMVYVISIVLPILLMVLAAWFIGMNYRSYLLNWRKELTFKKIVYYGVPAVIKSVVFLILVIIIHNYFHSHNNIELLLFIILYVLMAIFQSAYSLGGFLSRIKYISKYSLFMFRKKSMDAENFKDKVIDETFMKYSLLLKLFIIISFIIIFIPNISVFIVSNIFYFLMILSLLVLSLALNNIIYFGIVSLMIFQFDPIEISFLEVNYIVLFLSFMTILIGMVIETRMDNRMFRIVASRMIKSLNFSNGYIKIYHRKDIVVYQNILNKHYYIYYRMNGIVTVFESVLDAKLSHFIVRKMIFKGTQYLKSFGEI